MIIRLESNYLGMRYLFTRSLNPAGIAASFPRVSPPVATVLTVPPPVAPTEFAQPHPQYKDRSVTHGEGMKPVWWR